MMTATETRISDAAPKAQPCLLYDVLVNQEEELMLWPANEAIPYSPSGWMPTGKRGSEEDCLEFIEEHGRRFRG